MRSLGTIDKDAATAFVKYLNAIGIESESRPAGNEAEAGKAAIWVYDERMLEKASADLERFLGEPGHPDFAVKAKATSNKETSSGLWKARRQAARSDGFAVRRRSFLDSPAMTRVRGNIPVAVIITCVVIYLISQVKGLAYLTRYLYISEDASGLTLFPEVLRGQVWRLFTPILMHGSPLHLLFNMLWIFQLGRMIELIEGSLYFLFMLLVFALFSNVAEYLWSGPLFIGISGVVYGLLGYVFTMSRWSDRPYAMDQFTMIFMVGWLILGGLGVIKGIANITHLSGLIIGSAAGLARSGVFTSNRQR